MSTTYIGVGSNIERRKHVLAGIEELGLIGTELKVSTTYECPSLGFDSKDFYNLVVEMKTSLSLNELATTLKQIEYKWGRTLDAQSLQDRTLDLDILLYDDVVRESKPQLPRDDVFKYPFVVQPLFELCPDLIIPADGRSVREIHQLLDYDSLTPVDLQLSDSEF
ncbi:2-amino-4-hydroxy-6-hydroxymethyldihydropteridine diphosphokinase [Vibrio sp. SCSIO 43136]|uniref:2-amino-4-hydroxy-6- hydroxymethyldihydropteridine diphosphokinase n=1 Tax=Vibrio sp. SCSIO 43136 TaxID=2819101 RepID=UPI002075D239|nr:2-amino-4-hydroxy-6-hydroxymethyldihydropteridine diphosphokinase [Vibrio sp. SCSIO 43136]USD64916.1 2-amino-4-hydroxy-6-hydroxymethyldihydropteridine diphosphokinase [Vibrio sp. SCSIO 43136]